MGRLEPLTSLALGRSPYDDVVDGEGEADPHEPEKRYDVTGRIINPETRQTIRDVIRAHNEVMLVIGVAEPENYGVSPTEIESARQYQDYESQTGRTLHSLGRTLGILGVWGVVSIRQRILVYKKRADVPFLRLLHTERISHSFARLCFGGVPCLGAMQGLRWISTYVREEKSKNMWILGTIEYFRFHLHIFLTLQRLDLIPASQWFPGIKFFIPFSSSSPFSAPPLPESLDAAGIFRWIGKLALNLAPYTTFCACGYIWQWLWFRLKPSIRRRLPQPSSSSHASRRLSIPASSTQRQPVPESPTLGAADREIRHQGPDEDVPTSLALDVQTSGEPIPVGSIRRQSTFSSQGREDFGSDEEDSEMVNPTLISFDVDTSESPEPPTGVWSAELRPSPGNDLRQQTKEPPKYIVNPLTVLPASFASDIITSFVANLLFMPLDAVAFPSLARSFARARGIPRDGMFDTSFLESFSWRALLNLVQLDVVKFLINGEVWALTTMVSQWLHVTEEEWKEIRKEESEEETGRAS
ncbi:hypothetical protein F4779DRAFT_574526 [Xylariaceae sp. FL0662B]|nr:hypothetical protein F4779DRAFT_574526 [Xylariaceae sp. FL0662B]